MLYLSLLSAVILPVMRDMYSETHVTTRKTHSGATIRRHQGIPNSLRMRSLKWRDE